MVRGAQKEGCAQKFEGTGWRSEKFCDEFRKSEMPPYSKKCLASVGPGAPCRGGQALLPFEEQKAWLVEHLHLHAPSLEEVFQ